MRVGRLLGIFVLLIMTFTGQPSARAAPLSRGGPVQISALGHPGLCWQAAGTDPASRWSAATA